MGRLLSALFLVSLLPAAALADPSCFGLCSVDCVKPISLPDRWDDSSVPGSTGWSGNGTWDSEKFTDLNGNGIWDAGEPFQDGSSQWSINGHGPVNGIYDAERYDPLNTGYVAAKDLGLEISLKAGIPGGTAVQLNYYPFDLPNSAGGTSPDQYFWNWANCNPNLVSIGGGLVVESGNVKGPTALALRDLINGDPGAFWDDACQCVSSEFGNASPRLLIVPGQDPRIPITAGRQSISVTKLLAFFLEASDANANIRGRLVQIHRTGDNSCASGGDFVVDCAVPTRSVTWGGIKATYR